MTNLDPTEGSSIYLGSAAGSVGAMAEGGMTGTNDCSTAVAIVAARYRTTAGR